ncbi:MAG: glycosyltransferase family 4 protein [Patescibacteria group bacterium]
MVKETSKERVKKMAADTEAKEVDKRMKVVQIIADSGFGGGEAHVLGLLKNIDQKKFEPFLVCSPGILSGKVREIDGIHVLEIKFRSKFDFSAKSRLEKILSEIQTRDNPFRPMIVHTHGPRAGFIGRRAAPKGVYQVYTEHIWNESYHLENRVNEWLQKRALRILNYRTDAIIAVSNAVADFLIKNKMAPAKRVMVVPNGIDTKSLQLSACNIQARHGHQPPIIGNIGNLNLQKGQEYLIAAMPEIIKKFPLATLEIIGEGEEREALKLQITNAKLQKHVTLLGRIDNPTKYMKRWNVFVLPSISETFGIVVLEAMSTGVPVIATKVGGIADIVSDRKNGIMIKAESPSQIAQAVIEIIGHPALAAKLAREGKETAKKYDWRIVVGQIEEVYQKLARDKF